MLIATNLIVQRQGQPLNKPVSLAVMPNQLIWVKGANGIGKSTLLKTLVGLLKSFAGEIQWEGYKPHFFYLGHELAIKPQFTVSEQCRWHSNAVVCSRDTVNEVLRKVGLTQQAHTLCSQLSRGQQQRVAIACALLSQTKLWLLDEPLTALDSQSQTIIKQLLKAHVENGGAAIVASHADLTDIASESVALEAAS